MADVSTAHFSKAQALDEPAKTAAGESHESGLAGIIQGAWGVGVKVATAELSEISKFAKNFQDSHMLQNLLAQNPLEALPGEGGIVNPHPPVPNDHQAGSTSKPPYQAPPGERPPTQRPTPMPEPVPNDHQTGSTSKPPYQAPPGERPPTQRPTPMPEPIPNDHGAWLDIKPPYQDPGHEYPPGYRPPRY